MNNPYKFIAAIALVLAFTATTVTTARAAGPSGGAIKTPIGNTVTCNLSGMTGTTQCAGLSGSGLSYYVSSFTCSANAAETCGLSSSTTAGNACATSPTVVVAPAYIPANGGASLQFSTPIKVTANSALCCTPSATTAACTVVMTVAP